MARIPRIFGLFPLIAITVVGIIVAGFFAYGLRIYNDFNVPTKEEFLSTPKTGLTLLDRNGVEFFTFDTPGRQTFISYDEIPTNVLKSLLSAEDKNFFNHRGVSPVGIIRAAYLNLQSGQALYGGSTITQQLVKSTLLTPHKSFERKFREAIYALKVDQVFSKRDILEMYLNISYFGGGAYGIEEAAQTYFEKPAKELTLAESAYIIGLLPAPSRIAPFTNDGSLANRQQQYVLRRLIEDHRISQLEYEDAQNEAIQIPDSLRKQFQAAPHFALWIQDVLEQEFSHEYIVRSGLVVTTTIDLNVQNFIEEELRNQITKIRSQGASNAAAVVVEPGTGQILSMVGSIDWFDTSFGKYNMAVTPRQTGSAFKPIPYAAGLETRAITLASVLNDTERVYGKNYTPHNYNGTASGNILARYALGNSLNIPAVDLVNTISPATVASFAGRFGVSTLSKYAFSNLSIALGTEEISPLELTAAYATFASDGIYFPPSAVISIKDKLGNEIPFRQAKPRRAVSPSTAFLISSVLSDNDARRATFGNVLDIGRPAAAKTGTTQTFRDAWTVGYTNNRALGIWIGNNDNRAMRNLPGAAASAPVWNTIMRVLHEDIPASEFTPTPELIERTICPPENLTGRAHDTKRNEYFYSSDSIVFPCIPKPSPTPNLEAELDTVTILPEE